MSTQPIKTLKDAESAIGDLQEARKQVESSCAKTQEQLEGLKDKLIEKIDTVKDSIDQRISQRLNLAFGIAGGLIVLAGVFGYFGLQHFVKSSVSSIVGESTNDELKRIRSEAQSALEDIRKARTSALANPLIVLQTDYGSDNPYMGRLMGVIYDINPSARIQVITAQINNFDVLHAAWTIWRASRFYPRGTIFVVITNPGGMTSLPVVVQTKNGHIYIGPDNGCFDIVIDQYGFVASYTIASPKLNPPKYRDLFGGIDFFGPAAAEIAKGFPLAEVGSKSTSYDAKLSGVIHSVSAGKARGVVMDIDRYGNATTNITEEDLRVMNLRIGDDVTAVITRREGSSENKSATLKLPLKATYGHVSKGEPIALIHEGLLQLALNEESFAGKHDVKRRCIVEITHTR